MVVDWIKLFTIRLWYNTNYKTSDESLFFMMNSWTAKISKLGSMALINSLPWSVRDEKCSKQHFHTTRSEPAGVSLLNGRTVGAQPWFNTYMPYASSSAACWLAGRWMQHARPVGLGLREQNTERAQWDTAPPPRLEPWTYEYATVDYYYYNYIRLKVVSSEHVARDQNYNKPFNIEIPWTKPHISFPLFGETWIVK